MLTCPTARALRVEARRGSLNMAIELSVKTAKPQKVRTGAAIADYWALTKPEVNFLIAIATFAGFYLGYPTHSQHFPFALLIHTLVGTLLVASGRGR
jgi:heme O synthase-like polyprenyltransferase